MKGWVIDRDYLDGDDPQLSRVGYGQIDATMIEDDYNRIRPRQVNVQTDLKASEVDDPIRFRALDDDGEVYYGGAVTRDWLLGEEDLAYHILKFVEADAGATDVQFRAQDLPEKMVEDHRGFKCVVNDGGTEWVIVYG